MTDRVSYASYRGGTRPLAALVCAFVLLLSGCGTGSQATGGDDEASVGESGAAASSDEAGGSGAPSDLDFTSVTISGEAFDGADLAGKPTVFWFWAPWCPTCRGQISGVGELATTYGSEVNVVGVGSLDEPDAIEGFAEEVSSEVTMLTDPDGAVWRHFGVTAQSTYLVLDADGTEQAEGYLDDDELVNVVDSLAG